MNQAVLELLLQLKDEASKGLDNVAQKGGFLKDAFSFATGGLIQKGIEGIAGAAGDLFGGMLEEAKANQQGMAQLDAVLQSTGGKAGVTKEQVLGLVDSLSSAGGLSTASDDAVMAGENMLLTFTNIGKDAFPGATQAMLDMATKMNNGAAPSMEQMKAQAIQLGKALNDPEKGMSALSKAGVSFTEQQKEQIKTLQDSGDMMGAQKIILNELANEFGGSAAAAAGTFEGQMAHLGGVFDNVKQTLGDALLPILSQFLSWIGSPEVVGAIQQIAEALGTGLTQAFQFVQQAVQTVMPYIQPFIDAITTFWGTIAGGGDVMGALGQYFSDLGTAVANAWPAVSSGLGTLFQNIVQFIVDNGPTILATLGQWAIAFGQWVFNEGIPALMSGLGQLIQAVWTWIQENGPGILAQLGQWTQAFVTWVFNEGIPGLLSALGSLIQAVWSWIVENGPGILQTLGEWTGAFFNWVMTDLLPQIPGWLGNIINAVWTFITENGPTILSKLAEWTQAFFNWVFTDILPQVPGWLANIASALWTWLTTTAGDLGSKLVNEWIPAFWNWLTGPGGVLENVPVFFGNIASGIWTWLTTTAGDLGSKLVNEWIPAFWNWITGPGGVLENLGTKLGQIATDLWTWITNTAKDALTKAGEIGGQLVQGIMDGLGGLWDQIWGWISGILDSLWQGVVNFFTGGGQPANPNPPGKARGGPVMPGQMYMVGERGPELFMSSSAGSIIPNSALGGVVVSGNTITIQVFGPTDAEDLAREIEDAIAHRIGTSERIATGQGRR